MALFRGIQEYIALDANNITLVFDSGNIVNISGNILLYPPQGHPILYNSSFFFIKGIILTWHYRSVPKELRQSLIDAATAIILQHDFRPCKSHCAIEARPPIKWDKGRACIHVLRTTFGMDWSERVRIIYVGDDATDEDAMKALSGMALTFRVSQISKGRTAANRRLYGTQSVLTMLQWVQNHMDRRRDRRESRLSDSSHSD